MKSLLEKISLDTLEAQGSYGIGLQIGQQLKESQMDITLEAIVKGLFDAINNQNPAIEVQSITQALTSMQQVAKEKQLAKLKQIEEDGKHYLEQNKQQENVKETETGLQYEILTQGKGAIPNRQNTVRVHYTGSLIDGTIFDSSVKRGQPAEFPVNGVISGWIEALTMMPVGSKWRLTIPHFLAYGEQGAGANIPPFSTLVFEVELLEIL